MSKLSTNAHEIEERYDEIEESLDDLLIFPTRKGLRRSIEMMKALFVLEIETMKQLEIPAQISQSIMEEQQAILDAAKKELDNNNARVTSNAFESC